VAEQIAINLDKTDLYGWEFAKAGLIIGGLVRAIEAGETIRPVPVFEYANDYYLDNRKYISQPQLHADGGHHRAVAHLLAGVPLPAAVYNVGRRELPYMPVHIRDIKIVPADEIDLVEHESLAYVLGEMVDG
jgi:hypothetical protein